MDSVVDDESLRAWAADAPEEEAQCEVPEGDPTVKEFLASGAWEAQQQRQHHELDVSKKAATECGVDVGSLPVETLMYLAHASLGELTERLSGENVHLLFGQLTSGDDAGRVDWGSVWSTAHPSTSTDEPERDRDIAHEPAVGEVVDGAWLPSMMRSAVTVNRLVHGVTTALAGQVDRVFDLPADRQRCLGVPDRRSLYHDPAAYLRALTRVSRNQAKQWLQHSAQLLSGTPQPSGHVPEPKLPVVAEAVSDGSISDKTTERISKALQDVAEYGLDCKVNRAKVDQKLREGEKYLTGQARLENDDQMLNICREWVQKTQTELDQDGTPPRETQDPELQQGMRYMGRRGKNGLHEWRFLLDQDRHEELVTGLSASTNPRSQHVAERVGQLHALFEKNACATGLKPQGYGIDTATVDESSQPVPEVTPRQVPYDPFDSRHRPEPEHHRGMDVHFSARVREALQLEAFFGMASAGARQLAGTSVMPEANSQLSRVHVLIDYDTLHREVQRINGLNGPDDERPPDRERRLSRETIAQAGFTGRIPPADIRRAACDANIIPMVMGSKGQVLDVGTGHRTVTKEQKTALIARDRGCATPGCSMPAAWCQSHHITGWIAGGPTDLDNLVLVCPGCHRAVEQGKWSITVQDSIPWFTPAPWIDPNQEPRRNMVHHGAA